MSNFSMILIFFGDSAHDIHISKSDQKPTGEPRDEEGDGVRERDDEYENPKCVSLPRIRHEYSR
jgi:hypothetical protein